MKIKIYGVKLSKKQAKKVIHALVDEVKELQQELSFMEKAYDVYCKEREALEKQNDEG
jgi:hypothetical protein